MEPLARKTRGRLAHSNNAQPNEYLSVEFSLCLGAVMCRAADAKTR